MRFEKRKAMACSPIGPSPEKRLHEQYFSYHANRFILVGMRQLFLELTSTCKNIYKNQRYTTSPVLTVYLQVC